MIAPTDTNIDSTQTVEAPGHDSVIVIEPPRALRPIMLRELWAYRELLYFLILRDVKVKYKQTGLGVAWALLQPLVNTLVFTVIFSRIAHLRADNNIPYAVSTLAALLPWQLFSSALPRIASSLVANNNLLTKVYFPRLAVPLAALGGGIIDFFITFALLIALIAWYSFGHGAWHFTMSWALLSLPFFIIMALLSSFAIGVWFAALNVQYRDVQYITPFLVQVWLFLSPVAYPSSLITGPLRVLYNLNPMTGVIDGFRWALLGARPPDAMTFVSVGMILVMLIGGLYFFRYMERHLADII